MESLLEIHGGFTHIKPRFFWGYDDIYIILNLYPYRWVYKTSGLNSWGYFFFDGFTRLVGPFNGITIKYMGSVTVRDMGFMMIYPLVNVYIAMENKYF